MNIVLNLFAFLACFTSCITAKSHEAHLLSEIRIVDYEGPMTIEMLKIFRSVEVLEMINCNITSIPDRVLAHQPKLRKLHFENVSSTQIHPEVAQEGLAVEEFFYIHCSWDDPHLEYFNGYINLNKLVMTDQQYPLVELKANSLNRTKMRHLELVHDGIEKIDDEAFNNLDKLETLILADNKLKTISKQTLTPLTSLKELDLHGNLLESFEIGQIPHLPHLQTVDLSNNPLKHIDLTGIEKILPELKRMDLSNTQIPENDLNSLAESGYKIKKK